MIFFSLLPRLGASFGPSSRATRRARLKPPVSPLRASISRACADLKLRPWPFLSLLPRFACSGLMGLHRNDALRYFKCCLFFDTINAACIKSKLLRWLSLTRQTRHSGSAATRSEPSILLHTRCNYVAPSNTLKYIVNRWCKYTPAHGVYTHRIYYNIYLQG